MFKDIIKGDELNFDIKGMLDQAKEMQEKIQKSKEALKSKTIHGESGGGMVRVEINGANELLSINIDEVLYKSDDKKMLEDLVIAAVNDGIKKVEDLTNDEMKKVQSFLPNIPGLNLNL